MKANFECGYPLSLQQSMEIAKSPANYPGELHRRRRAPPARLGPARIGNQGLRHGRRRISGFDDEDHQAPMVAFKSPRKPYTYPSDAKADPILLMRQEHYGHASRRGVLFASLPCPSPPYFRADRSRI
jgi:hypothetical protein